MTHDEHNKETHTFAKRLAKEIGWKYIEPRKDDFLAPTARLKKKRHV